LDPRSREKNEWIDAGYGRFALENTSAGPFSRRPFQAYRFRAYGGYGAGISRDLREMRRSS
jgi:hypothetical protein